MKGTAPIRIDSRFTRRNSQFFALFRILNLGISQPLLYPKSLLLNDLERGSRGLYDSQFRRPPTRRPYFPRPQRTATAEAVSPVPILCTFSGAGTLHLFPSPPPHAVRYWFPLSRGRRPSPRPQCTATAEAVSPVPILCTFSGTGTLRRFPFQPLAVPYSFPLSPVPCPLSHKTGGALRGGTPLGG